MKKIVYIIVGVLLLSCTSKKENFGKFIINENFYPSYENDEIYIPHDYFEEIELQEWNGWIDTLVFIQKMNDHLIITNKKFGSEIKFTISKNFDIKNVEYKGHDVYQGSESTFTVEKVIFSMDANPFECSHITGFYTLQIRQDIFIHDKIKYGDLDTTMFYVLRGKFKVYSEEEKTKGRDWVISQNEIRLGIKDSLDVYHWPDERAEFALGNDALFQILKQFEVGRSETKHEKKVDVTFGMVIDENGKVNPNSMVMIDEIKSDDLINTLKKCKPLLSNWKPAIHKGKPVKSQMFLQIKIKD